MSKHPIVCGVCRIKLPEDKSVRIWTEVYGEAYHLRCLEQALVNSAKYQQIRDVVNGSGLLSGIIFDVWICAECGGHTMGYDPPKCHHCGTGAGYSRGKGHYISSDKIERVSCSTS